MRIPIVLVIMVAVLTLAPHSHLHAKNIPVPYNEYVTFETAHFVYIAERKDIPFVVRLTNDAEIIYETLTNMTGWEEKKKTVVIILDNSDEPGSYSEISPLNKIVINAAPPYRTPYNDVDVWLKNVFINEYARLLMIKSGRGINGFVKFFWGGYPPTKFSPVWYHEGYASYAESRVAGKGRGDDTLVNHFVMLTTLEDAFPPYDVASGEALRFPYYLTQAYFGARFAFFLEERFGETAIIAFQKDLSGFLPLGFNVAFTRYFKAPPRALWNAFHKEERKKALAFQTRIADAGATPYDVLATEYNYVHDAAVSSDGRYIFIPYYNPTEGHAVRLVDTKRVRDRVIMRYRMVRAPVFMDERRVAFLAYRNRSKYRNHLSLFIRDIETGDERRVRFPFPRRLQDIGYDRKNDRFIALYTDTSKGEVYTFTPDGMITAMSSLPTDWRAFQSPSLDDDTLIVAVTDKTGKNFIAKVNLTEMTEERFFIAPLGDATNTMTDDAKCYMPFYDAHSRKVYFASDLEGYIALYTLSFEDTSLKRVVTTEKIPYAPLHYDNGKGLSFLLIDSRGTHVARARENIGDAEPLSVFVAGELRYIEASLFNTDLTDVTLSPLRGMLEMYTAVPFSITPLYAGANIRLVDTVGRHAFSLGAKVHAFPLFSDSDEFFIDGGIAYENRSTPVRFSFSLESALSYVDLTKSIHIPAREHGGEISADYAFYLTDRGIMNVGFAVTARYTMPLDAVYTNAGVTYRYSRTERFWNTVSLSATYSNLKYTPRALAPREGMDVAFAMECYPKAFLNEKTFFTFSLDLAYHITVFKHLTLSFSTKNTLSTATTNFGGWFSENTVTYDSASNTMRYDEAHYNTYESEVALTFPIFRLYRGTLFNMLFVKGAWTRLAYETYGAFTDAYTQDALTRSIIGEVYFDIALFFTRLPMRVKLGASFDTKGFNANVEDALTYTTFYWEVFILSKATERFVY